MKKTFSLLISLLAICLLMSGCTFSHYTPIDETTSISSEDTGLTVHFISVDQGDCTLLESRGSFALIDGGEYSERYTVISYLNSLGVEELDFIISTHPHSDHCGSLSEVIRNFDTTTLICPNADTDSSVWEYVLDAADERGVNVETPEVYDTYSLGAATITILSPESNAIYSDLNDYSIVTLVEYGNTSFMLTGDAESGVEKALVRSGYDLKADVLKCGHHGSSTSSCEEFLDAVSPYAAIISCGADNSYGHPHTETINSLEKRNIPYWRTDLDGNIVIQSDGEKLYINNGTEEIESLTEATCTQSASQSSEEVCYIGNTNSKVFHSMDCGALNTIKNKVEFYSREEAVEEGYRPCGNCDP